MPFSVNAAQRTTVLESVLHAAYRSNIRDCDNAESLTALSSHFRKPESEGGGYRPLTVSVRDGETQTVEFETEAQKLPADPVEAGRAIRDRIASALVPTLLERAGEQVDVPAAFAQAQKIAILIADGGLRNAGVVPVQQQIAGLGNPATSDVHIVLTGRPDEYSTGTDCVCLCHTSTWRDDSQNTALQSHIVTNLALDEKGQLVADYAVHLHAPLLTGTNSVPLEPAATAPVKPAVRRGIIDGIRHWLANLFRSNDIRIEPSTTRTEAVLDQIKRAYNIQAEGNATQAPPSKELRERARSSWTARYATLRGKPVETRDALRDVDKVRQRLAQQPPAKPKPLSEAEQSMDPDTLAAHKMETVYQNAMESRRVELRPWTKFQNRMADKFAEADKNANPGENVETVTTSYASNGRADPTEAGNKINQRGMKNIHFRSDEAARAVGMPRTISTYSKSDKSGLLGEGSFATVTKQPRDLVLRKQSQLHDTFLCNPKNKGVLASPKSYADLDSFVPLYDIAKNEQVARYAGTEAYTYAIAHGQIPLAVFRKASRQLKELHNRNIYHLDIKLSNMTIIERGSNGAKTAVEVKFIDTDGMVQRKRDDSDASHPDDNVSTFRRTSPFGNKIRLSNKADDEYAFILSVIGSRSMSSIGAINPMADLNPEINDDTRKCFLDFIEKYIKSEYRSEVYDFLKNPANNLLKIHLHDMIEWDGGFKGEAQHGA
jgi:hypothetical protein